MSNDGDLGLGIWYLDRVEEYGRKIAGHRSRGSDRRAGDRRPICEDGRRQISASKAEVVPRENSFTHNVGTGCDGSGLVRCFVGQGRHGDFGETDSCGSGS